MPQITSNFALNNPRSVSNFPLLGVWKWDKNSPSYLHLNSTGKEDYFYKIAANWVILSADWRSYWNNASANSRAWRVGLIPKQCYKLFLVTFSLAYLSCTDWNQWRESNSWYWSSNFKMYATPARKVYINQLVRISTDVVQSAWPLGVRKRMIHS